jgi:hypothetical protein
MSHRYKFPIALFLLVTLLVLNSPAAHIFPARDSTENGDPISWVGSRTVFVGHYTWPDREPLGIYNDGKPFIEAGVSAPYNGGALVTRPDFSITSCDTAAGTCSTDTPLPAGGLPDGTEVKFVSTGTLPGGLVSWQQDRSKVYYIRGWSGHSFRISEKPDGPPVQMNPAVHGSGKHGMSFAGYMHMMAFRASKSVGFTCDPGTDVCTSEQPHLFLDGAPFYVYSSGKLPDGLVVAYGGEYMPYCLVYLSPTTFKMRQPPNTQSGCTKDLPIVHIKSRGEGAHYMYGIHYGGTSVPGTQNYPIFFQSISGYPRGTVFSWRGQETMMLPSPSTGGLSQTEHSTNAVTMFAKVPAVTPPGDYRITVHTSEDRATNLNPNSFQYTLKAVPLPQTPTSGPASYPPIPGLKNWEFIMTANTKGGGSDTSVYPRCANRKYPDAPLGWALPDGTVTLKDTGVPYPVAYTPGSNARVWFYNDDAFFKIAKYTNDPSWANCGIYIAKEMRDLILIKGPNYILPMFYFPWALVGAYRWTHDPTYKEAVIRIADAGSAYWGASSDAWMREHAFAFERRLARFDVTGEQDYNLQYFAEASLAQLYVNATGSPERTFNEPFMLGLVMRPLIRWYMISHDERVPVVVKLLLDRFWDQWYDKHAHHFYYNPEPTGTRCYVDCRKYTSSALNNLVSPAFAWYWRLTGDDTYRVRGDDLFSHVYEDGTPWSAKEWSQGFYWSFEFVEWREGKKAAY